MRDVIQGMNFLRACWRASFNPFLQTDSSNGQQDGLLWYKDIGQHVGVEFSMAVVQGNNLLEDQSQIESGSLSSLDSGLDGMFVGIYDGHGCPETSHFVCDHLFYHLKRFASEQQSMSAEVIRKAYQATEEGFLSIVAKQWPIAAVGSCCLVGVFCGGTLYIANLGDSCAVLGRLVRSTGEVLAIPLSAEHNVGIESVRQEMQSLHPDDPHIVVSKHDVWRVKGLIQPHDRFLIFASDGLWEHLTSQEAVDIVQNHPRGGIARRLVQTALRQAAKKREIRYSDLNKIDRGFRRHFHDDITAVVIFLDPNLASRACSVRGPVTLSTDGETNLPATSLTPNQLRPS